MWKQSFFWFTQPSTILDNSDWTFIWSFIGLTVLGIIFKILVRFMRHEVMVKLLNRFANLGLTLGLSGVVWFGLRFENTPIFADRYWAGLLWLLAIIWLGFIVKYLVTSFRVEKREFDKFVVNSKYIGVKK